MDETTKNRGKLQIQIQTTCLLMLTTLSAGSTALSKDEAATDVQLDPSRQESDGKTK